MKNNKGLTLVELIIAMGIMSLIFITAGSFMMYGTKTHKMTSNEFEVQSIIRLLASDISKSIRTSSATFTLYKPDNNNFTDKWSYIMVSKDKKRVVKYEWDDKKNQRIESVIMDEVDGATFRLEFKKNKDSKTDNLINFKIIADINGNERIVESGLEGLNSLQVIDKHNTKNPSNTIAYRLDNRPGAITDNQVAVAMVLDRSGSMAKNMNAGTAAKTSDQRIFKLKKEANALITELAKNPNIYVSLNPFSSTANGSKEMVPAQANNGANSLLTDTINSMTADGGTNTGDGMRKAYYRIKEFNEKKEVTKNTKNFMIILVDGVTTFSSVHKVTPIDYVIGDNQIDDTWNNNSKNYKTFYPNGQYYGKGSSLDTDGTNYVTLIGNMIQDYESKFGEGTKVYVIGFSNVKSEKESLKDIAKATSKSNIYYEAGDETALSEIFKMIKSDIDDSLWHIGGPS